MRVERLVKNLSKKLNTIEQKPQNTFVNRYLLRLLEFAI